MSVWARDIALIVAIAVVPLQPTCRGANVASETSVSSAVQQKLTELIARLLPPVVNIALHSADGDQRPQGTALPTSMATG